MGEGYKRYGRDIDRFKTLCKVLKEKKRKSKNIKKRGWKYLLILEALILWAFMFGLVLSFGQYALSF